MPGFETSRCQCSDAGATSLDPAEKLKAELIKQVTDSHRSMQRIAKRCESKNPRSGRDSLEVWADSSPVYAAAARRKN